MAGGLNITHIEYAIMKITFLIFKWTCISSIISF